MKKLILIAVCIFASVFTNAQSLVGKEVSIDSVAIESKVLVAWENSFEEAVVKATATKKPILIYFTGSDWCGPCKRLDKELFQTEKFKTFSSENLILYKADYPRNIDLVSAENRAMNKELTHRYQQKSFPTMIIINERGEVLGRRNGSYMSEFYYPFFEDIVQKNQ